MALQLWVAFTHPAYSPYSASIGGGGTGSAGGGIQAQRADLFVDSMGTNIHMDATPYTSLFTTVVSPAVLDLGIRVCRSGCFGTGSDAPIALTNTLYKEAGMQYILVSNPAGGTMYSNMGIQQYMFSQIDPTACLVIEGPNEVDNNNGNWGGLNHYGDNVYTFMLALKAWRDGHADSRVRAVKISTPTVTSNFGAVNLTHSFAFCDYGMAHPYTLPQEPGGPLASLLNAVAPTWGGSGSLPLMISETGFETAESASTPGYLIGTGVNNKVHAKYLQRQYFENWNQGVLKTCHYELMDDGTDYTIGEAAWGLMNANGTPKLAYQYVKNTIGLLRERQYTAPTASVGNGDLIYDDFNRVNANGWGNAPLGSDSNKTWADGDGNEAGQWAVSASTGMTRVTFQVRQKVGNSHGTANEVEWHFQNYRPNFSQLMRSFLRHTDYQNTYQLDVNGGVGNQISISSVVGGNTNTLSYVTKAEISSMISGSVKFRIIPQGSDNYLYAKAWNSTGSEPAAWDVTAIDVGGVNTILSGGAFGVWVDENGNGRKIGTSLFKASTVTYTTGSWPALSAFTPQKLDYTLTTPTGSVKSILFQKADSSFWLALWNRANSYAAGNPGSQNTITPLSCSVTLNTGSHAVTTYVPGVSQTGTSLGTVSSFNIMVPDEVVLVQIV